MRITAHITGPYPGFTELNRIKRLKVFFLLMGLHSNPLHPNIRIYILPTVLYAFAYGLAKRIC